MILIEFYWESSAADQSSYTQVQHHYHVGRGCHVIVYDENTAKMAKKLGNVGSLHVQIAHNQIGRNRTVGFCNIKWA